MELLKERIRKEGKILPGNIVKVDGFLNHRIDVPLMEQIAQEFRRVFAGTGRRCWNSRNRYRRSMWQTRCLIMWHILQRLREIMN